MLGKIGVGPRTSKMPPRQLLATARVPLKCSNFIHRRRHIRTQNPAFQEGDLGLYAIWPHVNVPRSGADARVGVPSYFVTVPRLIAAAAADAPALASLARFHPQRGTPLAAIAAFTVVVMLLVDVLSVERLVLVGTAARLCTYAVSAAALACLRSNFATQRSDRLAVINAALVFVASATLLATSIIDYKL